MSCIESTKRQDKQEKISLAHRWAGIGKRAASPAADQNAVDTAVQAALQDLDRLPIAERAMPGNFRYAGLGKRRVGNMAMRYGGIGKRIAAAVEERPESEWINEASSSSQLNDLTTLGKLAAESNAAHRMRRFAAYDAARISNNAAAAAAAAADDAFYAKRERPSSGHRGVGAGMRYVGMRYAGIGKRRSHVDAGMRYMGIGKRLD